MWVRPVNTSPAARDAGALMGGKMYAWIEKDLRMSGDTAYIQATFTSAALTFARALP
jgi:hypothetical protein